METTLPTCSSLSIKKAVKYQHISHYKQTKEKIRNLFMIFESRSSFVLYWMSKNKIIHCIVKKKQTSLNLNRFFLSLLSSFEEFISLLLFLLTENTSIEVLDKRIHFFFRCQSSKNGSIPLLFLPLYVSRSFLELFKDDLFLKELLQHLIKIRLNRFKSN